MDNGCNTRKIYSAPNFSAKNAFNASSFAEVLVEVGKQIGEAEQHCYNRDAELDSLKFDLKKSQESYMALDRERSRLAEMSRREEKEFRETIASLKLEREHFTEQNLRLHNELLKWRFKYPRDAKKMRTKPPITRATPPPVSPNDFTVKP